MSRPMKKREICISPVNNKFIPSKTLSQNVITLSLDQYEVIRLIDYEGLTQSECSKQLNVARTTVQFIYDEARLKIATSIVEGKELIITGGNVSFCKKLNIDCINCKRVCPNRTVQNIQSKEINNMKIAVTFENNQVFQHFGHTEEFRIYDVENGKIISFENVKTNGVGHGALASFLKERNVEVLVCGGIGGGAQQALANQGIKIYGGVSGECDKVISDLLNNNLNYNPNVKCDHHDHDENHTTCKCGTKK